MSRSINVLYIADQYEEGGAAQALIETVHYLKKSGRVNPVVATAFNDALATALDEMGVNHINLGHRQFCFNYNENRGLIKLFIYRPLYYIRYRISTWKAVHRAKMLIDKDLVDVIHSNVDRNDIGAILSRRWNKPHVWHLREMPRGHFQLRFNRIRPYQYMNRMTDRFIAISNAVKDEWTNHGINKNKIQVIYDGVDVSRIIPKRSYSKCEPCKIVCVGEVTKEKGQEEIINAMHQLKSMGLKFTLSLIGSGNAGYIAWLNRYISEKDLSDYITICGYSDSLHEDLCGFDLAINPSNNEGFGRTTVEYMAAGLCTIAKDSGATREVIDSSCGLLYRTEDELINALKLMIEDDAFREEKGRAASDYSRSHFDISVNVEHYLEVYEQCMSR